MSNVPVTDEELAAYKKAFKDFADAIAAISQPHNGSVASGRLVSGYNITADKLLDIYYAQKPKLVWYVGRNMISWLKTLKDAQGCYLLDTTPNYPPSLLGHDMYVVDQDDTLRLVTVGGNRE